MKQLRCVCQLYLQRFKKIIPSKESVSIMSVGYGTIYMKTRMGEGQVTISYQGSKSYILWQG